MGDWKGGSARAAMEMTDDEELLRLFREDIVAMIKVRAAKQHEFNLKLAAALSGPKPLPWSLTQFLLSPWGAGLLEDD